MIFQEYDAPIIWRGRYFMIFLAAIAALMIRALRRRPRRISACCTTPRAGPPPAPVQRKRRVGHRTMNNWDVTNKNGGMICMMRIESRYNIMGM